MQLHTVLKILIQQEVGSAIPVASLKNCSQANISISTPGGTVILTGNESITCDSTGSVTSGAVTGS